MSHRCDADRVIVALTGKPGHHSDDLFEIWHGMDTPALACGYHSQPMGNMQMMNVFRGHRARMGVPQVISIITENGTNDREVTVT